MRNLGFAPSINKLDLLLLNNQLCLKKLGSGASHRSFFLFIPWYDIIATL